MANPAANHFIEQFLAGVSRALLIVYLLFSPFLIEDELRRVDEKFNIAKIFLPLLAIIKLFFGFMHILLKSNSKEVTRLLLTMIFLSAIVLHSNVNTDVTFKDIYFNKNNGTKPENALSFLTEYLPFLDEYISKIPSLLDKENLGTGMTANVAELAINSTNLISYHWLIIIGVVSSICCHMIVYEDYSKIGRLGLGVFYILYGIAIMLLSEFQRPWIYYLSQYGFINDKMDNQSLIRVLMTVEFICCFCGISLLTNTKYKKLGIFISIGYLLILIFYEAQHLLIGQKKRNSDIGGFEHFAKGDMNIDLKSMLKYHEKYVYPTDYQLIRLTNLCMILSGTLFEMLKIYAPEKAIASQADYSSVDDKDEEELFNIDDDDNNTNNKKRNNKKKNNKKKKKQNKSESKKTK